jgi:ribosomal protein S12 methylthiotransferase
MKKVYMENLGCSKNQVDAETLIKLLEDDQFIHTQEVGEADLIMVNTCGFIESARQQSIESFFALHEANPDAKIILSGCMAQRYAKELQEELGEASAIFGNRDLSKINEVVRQVFAGDRVVTIPSYPPMENEVYERNELLSFPGSAYLKISEGCNHWCSYCAIPLIRGGLRSKPMDVIITEAKALIERGIKEINLIAQDLAAYGTDGADGQSKFMQLLEALVALEGDF